METVQVERSSPSSYSESNCRTASEESDGEVETSIMAAPAQQIPRVLTPFTNIFQEHASPITQVASLKLKKILGTQILKKSNVTTTPAIKDIRQSNSIVKFRDFNMKEFSPSRVRDKVTMTKIESKILPTITVGDITQSDQSRHFRQMSNLSAARYGECSVPEIFTESSYQRDSFQRAGQLAPRSRASQLSVASKEGPLFTQEHRDPDCF